MSYLELGTHLKWYVATSMLSMVENPTLSTNPKSHIPKKMLSYRHPCHTRGLETPYEMVHPNFHALNS